MPTIFKEVIKRYNVKEKEKMRAVGNEIATLKRYNVYCITYNVKEKENQEKMWE
ncbi:MAG TPA: hypothetical protein PLN01_10330 [Spirochaetota bacterium]|nr:hypothetical protein [Spirochaetota bacterium]